MVEILYNDEQIRRWQEFMEKIGVSIRTATSIKLMTAERGHIPLGDLTRFVAELNARDIHPNNKISWGMLNDLLYLYYEEEA